MEILHPCNSSDTPGKLYSTGGISTRHIRTPIDHKNMPCWHFKTLERSFAILTLPRTRESLQQKRKEVKQID